MRLGNNKGAAANNTTTRNTTRQIAVSLAPAAAIFLLQQVVFPVSSGVFLRGLIVGAVTALVALGLALVHRTTRVVNFAQADLGFAPAVLAFLLVTESGLPWGVAVAAAFATAIALGAGVERVVLRRFFRAPRLLVTIATLGASQVLAGAAILLASRWGLPAGGDATAEGDTPRMPAPFEGVATIGGVDFDVNDLLALIVAPACIAFVLVFLRRSSLGTAIRASADSSDRALLAGVPVFRLQNLVWMIVAGLGFLAVFLRSGILGLPLFEPALAFPLLLRALAAFLLGRMTDLRGITSGAVALGVLELAVAEHHDPLMFEPILLAIVLIALVLRWRGARPTERDDEGSAWQTAFPRAFREIRPVPESLAELPQVRVARWVLLGFAGWMALSLPMALSPDQRDEATALLVYVLLGLSLVLLSGWAGRLSAGQVAYFAVGAVVGAWTVLRWDVDLAVALVYAALAGAGVAVVMGIPALRLPGRHLAVTTLAFAVAAPSVLDPGVSDWVPEGRVSRASLIAGWDVTSGDLRVYYLVLLVLVVAMAAIYHMHASRFRQALRAFRDDESAALSSGVNGTTLQLVVYVLSGALAAVAGALFMYSEQSYDVASYGPLESIAVLTMMVVGGMTSIVGAALGALFLLGTRWLLPSEWEMLAAGAGALLVLLFVPGGMAGVLSGLRDRYLQHVARQSSIDVPEYAALDHKEPIGDVDDLDGTNDTDGIEDGDEGPLLRLSKADVRQGSIPVLRAADLDVHQGEVVALVGPHGAGRSTLLRAASGLVSPQDGTITFDGQAITGHPADHIAALGLVHVPSGRGVFPTLTVAENLKVASWLHRQDPEALAAGIDRAVGLFPVLGHRTGEPAAHLSAGEQQMLALAMAVVSRPKLLMIDELSLGPVSSAAKELARFVGHLRDEGVALLLVIPPGSASLELADRAVVLERGQVRCPDQVSPEHR